MNLKVKHPEKVNSKTAHLELNDKINNDKY